MPQKRVASPNRATKPPKKQKYDPDCQITLVRRIDSTDNSSLYDQCESVWCEQSGYPKRRDDGSNQHTAAGGRPAPSFLLEMPGEVRNSIWDQALKSSILFKSGYIFDWDCKLAKLPLSQVNRQIRGEVAGRLMSRHPLCLTYDTHEQIRLRRFNKGWIRPGKAYDLTEFRYALDSLISSSAHGYITSIHLWVNKPSGDSKSERRSLEQLAEALRAATCNRPITFQFRIAADTLCHQAGEAALLYLFGQLAQLRGFDRALFRVDEFDSVGAEEERWQKKRREDALEQNQSTTRHCTLSLSMNIE
ncbi:hypothetical protein BDW02DRAFT_240098 [Decorospora gaudefroyi]|uniref:Uncharacterized protein n=1 Tax=Decorospora gaudefroyi TaxID=184978 RepID=A0A6A5K2I5_9PLEO|nr:hypothetical protein BDW02DRAFT_240098 [Decorospora gaudefroyi]